MSGEKMYECIVSKDPVVIGKQFKIDPNGKSIILKVAMDAVECPHCHGVFAVESNYLDNVEDTVHCPMCCVEVVISDGIS